MPVNIGTVDFPTRNELQREGFKRKAKVPLLSARQAIEFKSLNLSLLISLGLLKHGQGHDATSSRISSLTIDKSKNYFTS